LQNVFHLLTLGFWTLSIVRNSITRRHNVSETGSGVAHHRQNPIESVFHLINFQQKFMKILMQDTLHYRINALLTLIILHLIEFTKTSYILQKFNMRV
jgi:hypothetical protein